MTDSDTLLVRLRSLNQAIRARSIIRPDATNGRISKAENRICVCCQDLLTVFREGENFCLGWEKEACVIVAEAIDMASSYVSEDVSSQRRLMGILVAFSKTRLRREISLSA